MRAVARRLGVSPNALYSHVEDKTALIDGVLDQVLAEVHTPTPEAPDPISGLRDLMGSTYDVLLAHPDLVPRYLARQGARGGNAQRLGAVVLDLLSAAGVTGVHAHEALRVLIIYTIGFAAFSTREPIGPGEDPVLPVPELRVNFERGLGWLLTGIVSAAR
ncbi:hypothetical protein BH20ACT5_BH20ACT5_20100 [soil metagenome]